LDWLTKDEILDEIKANINVVNSNKRWHVISMPDGNLYVNINFIKTILLNIAKRKENKDMISLINANDQDLNRQLIAKTIVLLKENINSYLLQGWKIGREFSVTVKDGEPLKIWFIPFRLDTFGLRPGELEKNKPDILRNITKISIVER